MHSKTRIADVTEKTSQIKQVWAGHVSHALAQMGSQPLGGNRKPTKDDEVYQKRNGGMTWATGNVSLVSYKCKRLS